jgi:hypothetical protein
MVALLRGVGGSRVAIVYRPVRFLQRWFSFQSFDPRPDRPPKKISNLGAISISAATQCFIQQIAKKARNASNRQRFVVLVGFNAARNARTKRKFQSPRSFACRASRPKMQQAFQSTSDRGRPSTSPEDPEHGEKNMQPGSERRGTPSEPGAAVEHSPSQTLSTVNSHARTLDPVEACTTPQPPRAGRQVVPLAPDIASKIAVFFGGSVARQHLISILHTRDIIPEVRVILEVAIAGYTLHEGYHGT